MEFWIEQKTYAAAEITVRFHHRLVWIHPFSNGNGRHARLMTDIVATAVLLQAPIDWGEGYSETGDEVRNKYISALRKADNGDYSLLMDFVYSDRKKHEQG